MSQDTFTTMVKDGKTVAEILKRYPEDKRILMRAMADSFMDGMIAQERLTGQTERPSA